jgi:hypothetical protein
VGNTTPAVRASAAFAEIWLAGTPDVRATTAFSEVWRSTADAAAAPATRPQLNAST